MAANRYEDIADDLRNNIANGLFRAGDQLPAETELARRYEASVPTVRIALGVLQDAGLIEKQQGRGNFVRQPFERITYSNDRFAADRRAAFSTALNVSVRSSGVKASDTLSALLQVPRGALLIEYVYLSHQGTSPHSLARIYVPWSVANLSTHRTSRSPLGDDIRGQLAESGVQTASTVERVTARLPDPMEAKTLRLGTGAPVLAIERISMDATGRVVEAALLVLPGHRTEAVFTTHAPIQELEAAG
ncbi:GntR family transcriptional regulator [Streptomyces sp. NBC_01142]|uniref:GntR family transcriptional regulator n=1 Tax=Streptomyces sp. NBC_01142 TaxID=2975865 RepID=UPI00225BFDE5|nr:GntR family transcriptional regulator [Streptomyces sp. NBC_01142]MCX4824386.1 GntR family transcriptional regulator [Streptomyces sp. NBC_01142]